MWRWRRASRWSWAHYAFRLGVARRRRGPELLAQCARIIVTRNGKPETVLLPERRNYYVQQQSLAEASLGVSWRRDLLATLGEPLGNDAWSMRLQVRPLMRYVWLGAVADGAAADCWRRFDRRYRRRREAARAAGSRRVQPLPGGAA